MILHIIYGISFAAWCGLFIVLPLYIMFDAICDRLSKAKHYRQPEQYHILGTGYQPTKGFSNPEPPRSESGVYHAK